MSPTQPPIVTADRNSDSDLSEFKLAVLSIKLLEADELERIARTVPDDVPSLGRALVRAGKLTPFQANALARGKARGLVIGNYFVLDKLGAGGMGVVFKARHRRLGRVVALKILPPAFARDPDLLSRFRREVDVAASLSHPNIVAILDADEDRGIHFMTMEYIEGSDLDRLVVDRGALAVDLALDCVIQAARGLEAAHARGIVHRDIKPGNLMLDRSGLVRVLDLGLARTFGTPDPLAETTPRSLTQSGTCVGTVDFMAPEQGLDSRRVDHRADIYSLGCTLCYLMTGRPPFKGENLVVKLMAHQNVDAESLRLARPDIPAAIDAAFLAMMSKKPEDRPATMSQVITLLEACRTRPGEADEARTGLKSIAASAMREAHPPTGAVTPTPTRTDAPADPAAGSAPIGSTAPAPPPRAPARTEPAWDKLIDFKETEAVEDAGPEPEEADEKRVPAWLVPVAGGSALTLAVLVASLAMGVLRLWSDPPKPPRPPAVASRGPGADEKGAEDIRQSGGRAVPTARGPDLEAEVAASARAIDPPSDETPAAAPASPPLPLTAPADPPVTEKPAEVAALPRAGPARPELAPGFIRTPRKAWLFDASFAEFNDWVDRLGRREFRPFFVSAHVPLMRGRVLGPGPVRIASIAVKDGFLGRVIVDNEEDHGKTMVEQRKQSFHHVNMTTFDEGEKDRVITLFSNRGRGNAAWWRANAWWLNDEFMAKQVERGDRIFAIATRPKGTSWRAVLATSANEGVEWKFHKELNPTEFRRVLGAARAEKFRPESLFICPKEGDVYLGVIVVRDASGLRWEVRENLTLEQLRSANALMTSRGYGPEQLVGFTLNGESRYVACWTRDPRQYPVTGLGDVAAAPIDEAVEQFLVDRKVPSATLAVFRKGTLVVSRGFGYADRDRTSPIIPDARMPLGGLSASFAASAVRSLLGRRKLGDDTPVSELLEPQGAPAKKPAPSLDRPGKLATTIGRLLAGLDPSVPGFTQEERKAFTAMIAKGPPPSPDPQAMTDDHVREVLLGKVLTELGGKAATDVVSSEVLLTSKQKLTPERDAPQSSQAVVRLAVPAGDVGRFFLAHELDGRPIRASAPATDGMRADRQGDCLALVLRRGDWLVVALLTLPDKAPAEIVDDLRGCVDLAVEAQRTLGPAPTSPAGTH